MRIVLSGSQQEANQYAGGGSGYTDSEEFWCSKAVDVAAADLREAGHEVLIPRQGSYAENVAAGNSFTGRDGIYLAVHTNAHNTLARGTITFYKAGTDPTLANAVHAEVAVVSEASDQGVKATTALGEVNRPIARHVALTELVFHDNLTDAAEMRAKWAEFGHAIARGVLKVAGGNVQGGEDVIVLDRPASGTRIWRLSNPATGDFFYSKDPDEIRDYLEGGYGYTKVWFDVAPGGTVPVHRVVKGAHHHLATGAELMTLLVDRWIDEGVLFYAHASGGAPVHRSVLGDAHLFTASEAEAHTKGWLYEGVAFYGGVTPPASECDPVTAAKAAKYDRIASIVKE